MEKPPLGQTTITVTTSGPNEYVQPNEGFCSRNQRNKPQSNSVGTAALIFITGGMSVAWSVGYKLVPSSYNWFHMNAAWFIGAIIGAFFSMILTNRIPKKFIYISSGVLVLIGGIIFCATDTYGAFVAARYLIGIGNGLIFVTCMSYTGEESVKEYRGFLASSVESSSFTMGLMLQAIYVISWSSSIDSFTSNQLFGIFCCLFSGIALIIMFFLLVESPVYHIVHNDNQGALESIRRLASPGEMTPDRYMVLDELNQYVSRNQEMSLSGSITAGLPGLFKLVFYRGLIALTYSFPVNTFFLLGYIMGYRDLSTWPVILFYALRWFACFSGSMIMDLAGRKIPTLLSILPVLGMSFGIAHIFESIFNIINQDKMQTVTALFFVFSFFVGLFSPASSVYLTEAFPLQVKPYFIGIAYIIEMILGMALLKCDSFHILYGIGGCAIAFFVLGLFIFPETKKTKLIDAQYKFQTLFSHPLH